MNRGAIAVIDALGFKGIWNGNDSSSVLRTLRKIGEVAAADLSDSKLFLDRSSLPSPISKVLKDPFVRVVQLSDTVVVAAGRRPRKRKPWSKHRLEWKEKLGLTASELENATDAWLRYIVCRCVCSILRTAALSEPSFSYRGVVTIGEFDLSENFILGPAVDEAAELMNLADGPFVWLSPQASSLAHLIHEQKNDRWEELTISHRVPLRDGRALRARVLDPFVFCDKDERTKAKRNILRRMNSPGIDVAIKKNNTREFFSRLDLEFDVRQRRAKRAASSDREPRTPAPRPAETDGSTTSD